MQHTKSLSHPMQYVDAAAAVRSIYRNPPRESTPMPNILLKPLGDNLIGLLKDLLPWQTLRHPALNSDDSFFMVCYTQKDISADYTAKTKKKEKFHNFSVSVFTHTEPPSAVYVLTYPNCTHYFKTLVQLQHHLIRHHSLDGGRDMDRSDDKRQPPFDAVLDVGK
jgi:hypothetical protein